MSPLRASAEGRVDVPKRESQDSPPLRNYLCLTMFTCFCPAWPINIVALVFSVMAEVGLSVSQVSMLSAKGEIKVPQAAALAAQKSYEEEDFEGSQRLGRKALQLGIVSFVIGLAIITAYTIVHFTTHAV